MGFVSISQPGGNGLGIHACDCGGVFQSDPFKGPHRQDQEVGNGQEAGKVSHACFMPIMYMQLLFCNIICSLLHIHLARLCEYDDSVIEYWVNIRTSGTLSREDLQRLSVSQSHEGEAELHEDGLPFPVCLEEGGFPDLGKSSNVDTEGDSSMQVPKLHVERERERE